LLLQALPWVFCPRPYVFRIAAALQVRLCLVINKVDRLILELCLTPREAYERLKAIIAHVNMIVSSFHSEKYISGERALEQNPSKLDVHPPPVGPEQPEPAHTVLLVGLVCHGPWDDRLPLPPCCLLAALFRAEADSVLAYEEAKADSAAQKAADGGKSEEGEARDGGEQNEEEEEEEEQAFSPERGNVAFGSAHDGWAFRIDQFAEMYAGECRHLLSPRCSLRLGPGNLCAVTCSSRKLQLGVRFLPCLTLALRRSQDGLQGSRAAACALGRLRVSSQDEAHCAH
jgi:translation elongation factor EF-G